MSASRTSGSPTAPTCASACTWPGWRPQVALNALFDRLPDLRLDPDAPDPFISGHLFRAPPRLDVVWG